jgi:hypothetical protein
MLVISHKSACFNKKNAKWILGFILKCMYCFYMSSACCLDVVSPCYLHCLVSTFEGVCGFGPWPGFRRFFKIYIALIQLICMCDTVTFFHHLFITALLKTVW